MLPQSLLPATLSSHPAISNLLHHLHYSLCVCCCFRLHQVCSLAVVSNAVASPRPAKMLATLLIIRQFLQNVKEVLQPYLYERHKLGDLTLRAVWDLLLSVLLKYARLAAGRAHASPTEEDMPGLRPGWGPSERRSVNLVAVALQTSVFTMPVVSRRQKSKYFVTIIKIFFFFPRYLYFFS